MKQLIDIQNRSGKELDETEAYLRHRARVHEREKREKLKKQGKLEEYLAEVEKNKPKKEPKKDWIPQEPPVFESFMKEYYASRQFDKENVVINSIMKHPLPEDYYGMPHSSVEIKKKVKKRKKPKKKIENPEDEILLNDPEFKPQMAGSTGLPKFFFSNLVKQNRSALQEAQARHRMDYHKHNKKHHKTINLS